MASIAGLRAMVDRNRTAARVVGVALLALLVFLTLGLRARRAAAPLLSDTKALRAAQSEMAAFRAAYRPAAGHELEASRGPALVPDSLGVSIRREARVTLAQQITARAEALGLTNVRVKFISGDTTAAPAGPQLIGAPVNVADYAVSFDCAGSFGAVLSLVSSLPSSVALQRMTVSRGGNGIGTQFHLTLAVFETPAGAPVAAQAGQHG